MNVLVYTYTYCHVHVVQLKTGKENKNRLAGSFQATMNFYLPVITCCHFFSVYMIVNVFWC